MQSAAASGRETSSPSVRRTPATDAEASVAHEVEEKSMESDEFVALLRRDNEAVNQRISDLDAHLGERIDHVDKRIDDLGTRLGERIDDTNKRIDDLGAHLGERIDDTNARLDRFDKRFEQVDSRFEQVDSRFEQVDKRFDELASYLRAFEQRMFDHVQAVQTELGRRIDAMQQFRLQGLALVVALTATSAIVGTFALQLFATF